MRGQVVAGEVVGASALAEAEAETPSRSPNAAIAAYEAILAKMPQIPLVHHNLGTLYKKKGDAARAQAEILRALHGLCSATLAQIYRCALSDSFSVRTKKT